MKIKTILVALCCVVAFNVCAAESVTLDFQSIALQDALRLLAKSLHRNIIVNSNVTGVISLHMNNLSAEQAYSQLLDAHDLTEVEDNHVWHVIPRKELLVQKEDEAKLQDATMSVTPLVTRIWQLRYAKAADLAKLIQDNNGGLLSKRGYLHIDARTNSLCVRDTAESIAELDKLIQHLDVPVQQVMIETHLASIDSDYERELGIDFAVREPVEKNQRDNDRMSMAANKTRYSLAVARLPDSSELDVQLSALETTGHGELISSPSLFTSNQQTASIESGEEIPYQETSQNGATSVTFKKAVLSLKVTPQILPGNKVLLELQINQDKPNNRIVLGVPSISTREIRTSILVMNGQTIVLGGIFESTNDKVTQAVPFLSKIPLVGLLFQQQNIAENKRELLVFVTPKIIDIH